MGRICPILDHPLNDGVLVDDDALVSFIQKSNVEFLPNELVCRSCKREITKLYNKKLKRAIELQKTRYHANSISSLGTSRKLSSASTTPERFLPTNGAAQNGRANSASTQQFRQQNGSSTNSIVQNIRISNSSQLLEVPRADIISVSQTSIRLTNGISKSHSITQENKTQQEKPFPAEINKSTVTIRKKTIKDYLTAKPSTQTGAATNTLVASNNALQSPGTHASTRYVRIRQISSDSDDEDDTIRRLSQEPTTSKAAAIASVPKVISNKRPITALIDSDDDDERLSLNAFNGTSFPNIQPIPPKRKKPPNTRNSLARDIMDDYIKDITGG